MALSNGAWCVIAASAALATFAIRSQSATDPIPTHNVPQASPSAAKLQSRYFNGGTPDSTFAQVTAAQMESGNPHPGASITYGARGGAPQDIGQDGNGGDQPQDQQDQTNDNGQNYDDLVANQVQQAQQDQSYTADTGPNVTLNLNNDRQAADIYQFTNQELMDRVMAIMNPEERNAFSVMWLSMDPSEQSDFLDRLRYPY